MSIGTEADSLGFHSLKDLQTTLPGQRGQVTVRPNHHNSFSNLKIGSRQQHTAQLQSVQSKKRKYYAFAAQKKLGTFSEEGSSADSTSSRR
mmetsp:Transcript_24450/g.37915  ORF Transcript_24450/g.37915 Transcript_24450/m.37915 type:complete len:91 (-) Transcript_24450:436-708(-)